ncbi:hypothetical protein H6G45_09220 [Synechocystis sp. FACHB-383]|uniref:head-tail joining protein n=1 Tax=Synechocystis sp. FACHB-383 TaxID=2692864 RepID=UPI0016890D8D|nr:hypothetical protein [Synechocystis sp. FACHB-383]MBD2653666.1 hypothetical protein [Synechocystis sp. FACHB-383]
MFEDDLTIFFADFGEDFDWNGQTLTCIFNEQHDPLTIAANGLAISALVKKIDVPGIQPNDAVAIRDKDYTVAEINPIQDGRLVKIFLEEA